MRFIAIIIFLLIAPLAKAQSVDSIYAFINQFFCEPAPREARYLIDKPSVSYLSNDLFHTDSVEIADLGVYKKALFSREDSTYIVEQIKKWKHFRFKQDRLQKVVVISGSKIDEVFQQKDVETAWSKIREQEIRGFHILSVPIFYDNGRKAIFASKFGCGSLCGGGEVAIYETIDGKWKIKEVLLSVSH